MRIQAVLLFLMSILLLSIFSGQSLASKEFPEFPEIRHNVAFWEKIYSTHSINTAVIHDRNDLSKVYEVLNLPRHNSSAIALQHQAQVQKTVEKYQMILTALGRGQVARTTTEKRVFALFKGPRARERMTEAAQRVRSQTGQKERFKEGVIRSGAYMGEIKKIFRDNGLPTDLAYLPHVESSFDIRAYSKFGAAGIWQFTRATGKQYLQIDDAVDERRDPIVAAHGAAAYLKNSYRLLGEWPLALTAYNYGTSGMLRAQKAKGSYGKIFQEYREGHFGFASQNFYSEFLAALYVAKKLEADPAIRKDSPRHSVILTLPGYIRIDKVQRHFNISTETLKELNPALRDPVYSGHKLLPKGYGLRLPQHKNISSLASSLPRSSFFAQQLEDAFYKVKSGDTAGSIAAKYNIRLSALIQANSLDKNGKIYVGQRLQIPPSTVTSTTKEPTTTKTPTPYLTARDTKRISTSNANASPDSAPQSTGTVLSDTKKHLPAVTPVAQESISSDVITVHPEESLALYAQWLKISEDKIRKINNIKGLDAIQPGQQITILYSQVSAAQFADLRSGFARENEEDFFAAYSVVEQKKYTVQQGDTLWDLCNRRFNIPLWLLGKYNQDLDYSRIHLAQELVVPVIREL
jgi:membrane-bound lytic murein transglycosylase D